MSKCSLGNVSGWKQLLGLRKVIVGLLMLSWGYINSVINVCGPCKLCGCSNCRRCDVINLVLSIVGALTFELLTIHVLGHFVATTLPLVRKQRGDHSLVHFITWAFWGVIWRITFYICNKCTKFELSMPFFARDSIYAKRAYAIAIPSVCPSVCLSHGWFMQKRLKLGSRNFHHTVTPSL